MSASEVKWRNGYWSGPFRLHWQNCEPCSTCLIFQHINSNSLSYKVSNYSIIIFIVSVCEAFYKFGLFCNGFVLFCCSVFHSVCFSTTAKSHKYLFDSHAIQSTVLRILTPYLCIHVMIRFYVILFSCSLFFLN